MSLSSQFSLALELSNVFPIRRIVESVGTQLLNYARELRRSGSDIVVEEDLAAVFGRGSISSELEDQFRSALVKPLTFVPLTHAEGEIMLASGPGPTMRRAFKERPYFATVVQLSLLAWMQTREELAKMLSFCMQKRVRMGVEGASDPGYQSISATLAACSSQSSNFTWSFYSDEVQAKLRSCFPEYRFHRDYVRMSDTLLSGAMDYFYLVQSLPEHRKILVSNQTGYITLVVWAHYVLGLRVAITLKTTSINFGDPGDPQLIIKWEACRDHTDDIYQEYSTFCTNTQPEIQLRDQDMSVILRSFPEQERRNITGRGNDRHTLLGFGTAALHRLFNARHITIDNDPIYEESAKLITAFAVHVSSRLDRMLDSSYRGTDQFEKLPRYGIEVEVWRVLASSQIIFEGVKHDLAGITSYVELLSNSVLSMENVPASLFSFFKKTSWPDESDRRGRWLLRTIRHLAKVVLLFAFVINVERCAEMPVILDTHGLIMDREFTRASTRPDTRITIAPDTIFFGIVQLLSDDIARDRNNPDLLHGDSDFVILFSDFGWSVFLDTIRDKDPADVKAHLIHVEKGVPTNEKTNERKLQIIDGSGGSSRVPPAYRTPVVEENPCIPRAVVEITRREEYWTTLVGQYQLALRFVGRETRMSRIQSYGTDEAPGLPVERWMYCRSMHRYIWETFLTPQCEHEAQINPETPLSLGPDALAIRGWTNIPEFGHEGPYPQRIVIFLTRGDARLRWLAVRNATQDVPPELEDKREVMLRTANCCDKCALEHALSLPGRWTLIL